MELIINLPGYENISLHLDDSGVIQHYQLCCSQQTTILFKSCLEKYGKKPSQWPKSNLFSYSQGLDKFGHSDNHHSSNNDERRAALLIQEIILRARGEWKPPYAGETVCNCRGVSSEEICHAITAKASSVEEVSQWTTASTSCTTCKDKIVELIQYRFLK